MATQAP